MRSWCYMMCVLLLLAACSGESAPPTSTVTPVPTLTDTPLPPSPTPALPPAVSEETPEVVLPEDGEDEGEVVEIIVQAAEGQEIDPPLSITLPEGWGRANIVQPVEDVLGFTLIPSTIYGGPVTGGDGYIVLLWGFRSVAPGGNPLLPDETDDFDLWMDGVRLLRLAVVEPECNIGTDVPRDFVIGNLPARGTIFAAVTCPETVDTRGWVAGLSQDGINFLFYAFTEPITAMDGPAAAELQAVLDTVEFRVDELLQMALTPTATP
jgi:hypothetical protein